MSPPNLSGSRVSPELGAALVDVLGDPRLGAAQRWEIETVLIESEDMEGWLDDDARRVTCGAKCLKMLEYGPSDSKLT